MDKICPICGQGFHVDPCEFEQRKTCSQKCRGQYLHLQKIDAPCSDCKQKPRVLGRSYCRECGSKRSLATYYRNKTCPNMKRLTDEEKHEYKLKKMARYRARNRAALNEKQKRYYRTHYAVHVRNVNRRRACKAGVFCNLTHTEWGIIKAVYRYRCAYCGKKPKVLTKDHVVPLSKGGAHTANNIVPTCRSCNSRKHVGEPPNFQPILIWSWDGIVETLRRA